MACPCIEKAKKLAAALKSLTTKDKE